MDLEVYALEMKQPGGTLYSFIIDGKLLGKIGAVARVTEGLSTEAIAYQRPEIASHVRQISKYISSAKAMVPTAVVLAMEPGQVKFKPTGKLMGHSRPGIIRIQWRPECTDLEKPFFIVDGQQRLAGIRDAEVAEFPLAAMGFMSDEGTTQVEQFILTNSSRNLPAGLIYRLLPRTVTTLPNQLEKMRIPAMLLDKLNTEEGPLQGKIVTPTNKAGVIRDRSMLNALSASLQRGALSVLHNPEHEERSFTMMVEVLNRWWRAVSIVFAPAWGLPPTESRLSHGVGVLSLSAIFDLAFNRLMRPGAEIPSEEAFVRELKLLAPFCHWTEGSWQLDTAVSRPWDDFQNTSQDIGALTNYLCRCYLQASSTRRRAR